MAVKGLQTHSQPQSPNSSPFAGARGTDVGPGVAGSRSGGAGGCGRGQGPPGDSAHPGTGDIAAPHGLWQQQATSSFMGGIEGGSSACARLWGTCIFNILGA